MALSKEEADDLLPSSPVRSKPNPAGLNYLIIAPPKWGKTTFACAIPNALLLAFERGHAFQEAYKICVDCWDVTRGQFEVYEDEEGARHMSMKIISNILTSTDKFDTIIFDTADMAAKMCVDFYLQKNGWQHAKDGGDYGAGYDIVQNTPMRQLIGAIMRTGRGIVFLTHSQINEKKIGKTTTAKKETTLPGGVHKFLHTQADVIMHGSFGVRQKGRTYRDRIIQTEGDEETLAGNRCQGISLPGRYIVDPKQPWEQWANFFEDPLAAETAEKELQACKSNKQPDHIEEEEETEVEAVQQEVEEEQPKKGKKK